MLDVASVCTPCCMLLRVARSCRNRLHTTANTDAAIPNIVGATMLGDVASDEAMYKRDATLLANSSQRCWMLGDEDRSHRANPLSNTELFCTWWPGRKRTYAWSQKREHWVRDCVQTALREGIFDLPYPPTPGTGPLETNPHSRDRRAGLVPGVAREGWQQVKLNHA